MPLIHKRNNKWPEADCLGAPHVFVLMLDKIPCRKTYCLRFLRKEPNQLLANPRVPSYSSFSSRILWFTVPIPFEDLSRLHKYNSYFLDIF